jgi:hypothetical protein
LIELESPYISESDYSRVFPRFSVDHTRQRVRIGHCLLPFAGYRDMYGNIFWCAVGLKANRVKDLVRYLVNVRDWQIVSGPTESRFLPKGWAA